MPEFNTPMMKQYVQIKKQYQDCLLFYRMGDFYELFMEDAHIGSRVLNITLTSRAKGKDGRIPMAGVPYHAVDSYLSKLVKAGFKVAICEQVSLPNKYGIIDREVVRIVTPGTILDEKALAKKDNNYIISLLTDAKHVALTIADISTGYFSTTEIETQNIEQVIKDELARIQPTECILPAHLYNDPAILKMLKTENNINIFPFLTWESYADDAEKVLKKHFGVGTLAGFGIEEKKLALQTAASLLGYLQETQKGPVNHIKKISLFPHADHLVLDRSTMLNLELFTTIREHDTRGTLLSVLDDTVTPMGGRLIKQWLKKPLTDKKEIEKRYDAIEALLKNREKRMLLRQTCKAVSDIERLLSRLSVGLGNARDLVNLKLSLETIVEVKNMLEEVDGELIGEVGEGIKTICHSERSRGISNHSIAKQTQRNEIPPRASLGRDDKCINDLISLIHHHILPEPPISLREGGIIQSGINKELDKLRKIVGGGKQWIIELERKERERTGISSLKVRFNQVFGFYIEVSKANLHAVPGYYMRKQTLVNAERFITPELKEQEEIILTAEQKINDIEYTIFQEVLQKVLDQTASIQDAAHGIAILDCLLSFAEIAEKRNYTRPKLLYSGEIRIKGGRHPVVETLLDDKQFVPNDLTLDNISRQLLLITGPNMAGKSVFIRQTALLVLMAHIGSFVPAEQAHISIVDRIFVRSGASDVITSGLSTFMVEMVETAHILHHATKNSLIIMDEIGRGTSTYDGISIAWAVAEYLVNHSKTPPKTLFATHYHELQALEEQFPKQIKNMHMAVAHEQDEPVFLYTLLPGGASHSFGVAVARLAGIPEPVITRAKELLEELETRSNSAPSSWLVQDPDSSAGSSLQLDPKRFGAGYKPAPATSDTIISHFIIKDLEQIDIHQLTPLEALNKLAELKEKLKLLQGEEKKFLEA